jgi:hypothetical protein
MQLIENSLSFYWDKEMLKAFLTIPWEKIICVNKRQIEKQDLYTFSIHYFNEKNKQTEIRLKCISRSECDDWIKKFNTNKEYRIKKFKFVIPKEEVKYEDIVKQEYLLKPKEFYMKFYKGSSYLSKYLKKMFFKRILVNAKGINRTSGIDLKDIELLRETISPKARSMRYHDNEKQPLVHTSSIIVDANDIDVVVLVDTAHQGVSI